MRRQERKYRKRFALFLSAVLILAAVQVGSFAAGSGDAPEEPSRIRLSWTVDPRTTMTLTWQDAADVEDAWVEYTSGPTLDQQQDVSSGTPDDSQTAGQSSSGDFIHEQRAQLVEPASTLSDGGTQWTAILTELQPGTTYRYQIASRAADETRTGGFRYSSSELLTFTTQPTQSDSLSFTYFGDIQVNQDAEGEFVRWGELAQSALARNPDLQFGIMGGDIVENGIRTEQFDRFFDAASPVFSGIPLFATNGNHESNFPGGKPELYLDSFALPENGPEGFKEEFYSFDAGPAHMLVLNSWVYSGEQKLTAEDYEQILAWIREDLQTAEDVAFKIVVMHHPLYAVHSDGVADLVREHWGPALEEAGVDLLLCGHQHVYCRSLPLTEGSTDPEHGITQVMGVSGEKFYSSADETNMERTVYEVSNYQVIRIHGDSLELQSFDKDGQELDYVTLSSRREPGNPVTDGLQFTDVSDTDWFAESVAWAVGHKVFNGVSDTEFAPDRSMTRAMFATVLWRLNGSPEPASASNFTDVQQESWYTEAVGWASENGLITGYGDGLFGTNDPVTREQIAAILFRYTSKDPDKKEMAAIRGDLSSFADRQEISQWAVESVSWASGIGVINGMGDGMVAPKDLATRAQVAQIIRNFTQSVS